MGMRNLFNKEKIKHFILENKNILIVVGILILVGIISLTITHAYFTGSKSSNVISGIVGDVTNPDVNMKYMVENLNSDGTGTGTYSIMYNAPTKGYTYNSTKSNCSVGTLTNNGNGTFTISSSGKTKCELYYDSDGTITNSNDTELVIMKEVTSPMCMGTCGYKKVTDLSATGLLNLGFVFNSTLSTCTNGGTVSYDYVNNKIVTSSTGKSVCNAYFTMAPIITSLNSSTTTTSITVNPQFKDSNYTPSTYYYSKNGGTNYTSSTSNSYTFSSLASGTEYTISIYVTTSDGRKSNVYQQKISTTYSYTGLFSYTGATQTYVAGASGYYQLQVWGAQGGSYYTGTDTTYQGGLGGYSKGTVYLNKGTSVYIYVGGAGTASTVTTYTLQSGGGFNGGGNAGYEGGGGGGASDIRIGTDSLYARVIVAGGGGGSNYYTTTYYAKGGYGGGISGASGSYYSATYSAWVGGGASENAGGTAGTGSSTNYYGKAGSFGVGGDTGYKYNSTSYVSNGAGGGGWYGGGGAGNYSGASRTRTTAGGGGSGYVYTSSTASDYPSGCLLNSGYYLTSASTNAGNVSFESTSGSTETGHAGDGYAKITYIGT
jgi:hypothetical protein